MRLLDRRSAVIRLTAFLLLALGTLLPAGCTTLHTDPGSPPPSGLSLKFHIATKDNRRSYYEVTHDNELYFGGGRNAMSSTARPVGPLTEAQRRQIWDVITQNHLASTEGSGMFANGEKVTYDLSVRSDSGNFGLHAIDDQAPGLAELEKLLAGFKSQVDVKIPALQR